MATTNTKDRRKRGAKPAPKKHAPEEVQVKSTTPSAWDPSRIQTWHRKPWEVEELEAPERLSRLLVKEAKASIYELHCTFAEIYFQGNGWPADAAIWNGMEQERDEALATDEVAPSYPGAIDGKGSGVLYGGTYMTARDIRPGPVRYTPWQFTDPGTNQPMEPAEFLGLHDWFAEYANRVNGYLLAAQYDEVLKPVVLAAVEALKEWRPGLGGGKGLWDRLENDTNGKKANEMTVKVRDAVRAFVEGIANEPFGIERDFVFLRDAAYYGLNAAMLRENPNDPIGFAWVPIENATWQHNVNGTHPNAIWNKALGREIPSKLSREGQLEEFVRIYLETVASIRRQWEVKDSPQVDECLMALVEQLKEWKPIVHAQLSTDLDAANAAKVKLLEGVESLLPKMHAPAAGRLKWKGYMGELAALIRELEDRDWIPKNGRAAARGRIVANLFEAEDGTPFDTASFEKWMQPMEKPPSRVDFSQIPQRPKEPAQRKREVK